MDFFEKLTNKASDTYKTVADKTGKLAAETKIKFKINDNKSKINELYKEMGKKVFEKYALDGNLDIKEHIEDELNKIQALCDEIKDFEKQLLELSDIKECINCKNKIDKSVKFCPNCGAEQPEGVKTAEVVETADEIQATDLPDSNEEIEEQRDSEEVAEDVQNMESENDNSDNNNGEN